MNWLIVITISILSNQNIVEPKSYEIVSKADFAMCSFVKADLDFIFRNPTQTVVIKGDCTTEEEYRKSKV